MIKATFYGYNPPFIGGARGVLSRQEDIQIIKNDILQLLLTRPGERIYRPNFGTNLNNLVFANVNQNTIQILKVEITDILRKEEPRVNVKNVDIIQDEHYLYIKIAAVLKSDPKVVLDITKRINVAENADVK